MKKHLSTPESVYAAASYLEVKGKDPDLVFQKILGKALYRSNKEDIIKYILMDKLLRITDNSFKKRIIYDS